MTICVTVRVNECLVFAADSATTLSILDASGKEEQQVFRHGHKVFNLTKGLPICAMTYGTGNIGKSSVSMLSKEFRTKASDHADPLFVDPDNYTVKEFAEKFRAFLYEEKFAGLGSAPKWSQPMGVYVGGYGSNNEMHEVHQFIIATDGTSAAPVSVGPPGECGMNVGGNTEAFGRLLIGFDGALPSILYEKLQNDAQVNELIEHIRPRSEKALVWDAMPVQDAIDLANFLVDTTKGFVRFQAGHDTVGGETDIAVVTRHEGFKWVRRKHYFSQTLNPKEV